MTDYTEKTVIDLRGILRDRGLKVSGRKCALVARLRERETGAPCSASGTSKGCKKALNAQDGDGVKLPPRRNDGELVRPRFWNRPQSADTISHLQKACDNIIKNEGQLDFHLQAELFEYIFWPPPPGWCLAPLHVSNSSIHGRPTYGHGADADDQIWKHAVLGLFQAKQKHFQLFQHILIPVYFPWADDSLPIESTPCKKSPLHDVTYTPLPMWGLLHYKKGSKTAYMHVLTEWQEQVFNNKVHNSVWTRNLIQRLTGEKGMDANLFYGNRARIKTKWLPNLVGPAWRQLGWSGRDMAQVSHQTFFYMLYVAKQLVKGTRNTEIPGFGACEAFQGLAQALSGVCTALEHGEVGASVWKTIRQEAAEDASPEALAHRAALEVALGVVTEESSLAVRNLAGSETEFKLRPGRI